MNDSLQTLIKRIEELETQLAFQDELHETLNTIVVKQDAELRVLKRQMGQVAERVKEIGDTTPGAQPQDETPPHY